MATGYSAASEEYGIHLSMDHRHINAYSYRTIAPSDLPPEPIQRLMGGLQRLAPGLMGRVLSKAMAKGNAETLARVQQAEDQLQESWEKRWLPAIQQAVAFWEGMELEGADGAALLTYWNETLSRLGRIWTIHFEISLPAGTAVVRFDDFHQKIFPGSAPLDAQRLLQGIDNSFLAGDRALWALSRTAASQPEVEALLLGDNLAEIPRALAVTAAGRAFWVQIAEFLAQHGRRGQQSSGFREESWVENPTTALLLLRAYLRHPQRSPVARQEKLHAERESALAAARARLADRDETTRSRFEELLSAAQMGMYLHEEHNYWIDQRSMYEARRLILACGRVLAEGGTIGAAGDIWHITLEELKTALAGNTPAGFQAQIDRRKQIQEHFRGIEPPRAIGTTPLLEPSKYNPRLALLAKTQGIDRRAESHAHNELLGNAGSAGRVRGKARVIHDLADAYQLQQGEILIAATTMPPWTPLFSVAAGLVTETGGILSHAAVVAREYGIPAVVGAADATVRIVTGRMIEVDGSAGMVRLL